MFSLKQLWVGNRTYVTSFLSSRFSSLLPSVDLCLTIPGLWCCAECECSSWLTWISEGIVKHYRESGGFEKWGGRRHTASIHPAIMCPGHPGGLQLSVSSDFMSLKEKRKTWFFFLLLLSEIMTSDGNRVQWATILFWKAKHQLLFIYFQVPMFFLFITFSLRLFLEYGVEFFARRNLLDRRVITRCVICTSGKAFQLWWKGSDS